MQYRDSEPLPLERLIAALSYLTMGLIGFIWMILGAILKLGLKPFLKFHIFQSIFLSILFYLLSSAVSLVLGLLSYIPFIGGIISTITFYIATPLFGPFSFLNLIFITFIAYLIITSLRGKFSYIPWVSDIIKTNIN